MKALKDVTPNLKIGVTGCVAQAEGPEICAASLLLIWWWGHNPITASADEARVREGLTALDTDFPKKTIAHLKGRNRRAPCALRVS